MDEINQNRNFIIAAGILIILAITYWFWPTSNSSPANSPGNPANAHAVPVTVITLQKEQVDLQEELPGRIVPYEVAEIRPQVTGIITKRLFEEGSEVQEGQQLYQIDPTPYEAAYNRVKADVAKAEANLKLLQDKTVRYNKLIKIDSVSKQDYDDISAQLAQAQADVSIAKANLETAKINLDYTQVYAPIAGRTGRSEVTKGALVTANQAEAIMRITKLDPIYVDLTQSSDHLMHLRPTLQSKKEVPIALFLENNSKPYQHPGKLQFMDVTVDQTTGSVTLRGIFPNPERELLPGMFVRAQIKLESFTAILVPQQAVIRNPDGSAGVWVVNAENKANPKPIIIGQAIENKWLVTGGVDVGENIVLEGFQKLMPGALVMPTMLGK